MNVGLSTLYNIGSNYSIRLNDKEVLVYEEDDSRKKSKNSQEKKLEKEQEQKKVEKEKSANKLSPDEERLTKELQSRDTEVKAHEAAHQAAGGGMTGAASYSYQQGPDGKMYAIGGEVSISMKSGSSPEETARNARQIMASAMAAGSPSPQDYAVASSARIMEMKAEQQIAKKAQEETLGKETYKKEADKLHA
ncbi:MAG: putative metalloprotease CJM1_0395 family protein [Sulfurimonas sp.]|jgi:hypothetical protein